VTKPEPALNPPACEICRAVKFVVHKWICGWNSLRDFNLPQASTGSMGVCDYSSAPSPRWSWKIPWSYSQR
jgi:hypothetical protein